MQGVENSWKPAAMSRIESEDEAPAGFKWLVFAGIGLKAKMLEPTDPNDWETITSDLQSWGEIPQGDVIVEEVVDTDRGINLKLNDNGNYWLAEFFPWGTDGRFRARISLAPSGSDLPVGGYTWEGMDIISIRKWPQGIRNIDSQLHDAINSNDLSQSKKIIFESSAAIGRYHKAAETARVTPRDAKRWNKRIESLEALLRAQTLWRAPHTKDTVCIIAIGDVRFSDMIDDGSGMYSIHLSRPRLADSILKPECEFPAIRDFSSLLHDLNRVYFSCDSDIKISELRSSLIEGWRSTAPPSWSSKSIFYTPRGGAFFWEYEQCLLDVIEAVSHQSGKPDPAVSIIQDVPYLQKSMFSHRTIAALSFMTGFFSASGFYKYIFGNSDDLIFPLILIPVTVGIFLSYRRLAPSAESSILRKWN
ncbi:MAG: hypothetical protein OR994_04430 [Candidatus Poseidoniales archaeon]|nr:hypothetical protein [Candidatus Poseidoniales archaeon]